LCCIFHRFIVVAKVKAKKAVVEPVSQDEKKSSKRGRPRKNVEEVVSAKKHKTTKTKEVPRVEEKEKENEVQVSKKQKGNSSVEEVPIPDRTQLKSLTNAINNTLNISSPTKPTTTTTTTTRAKGNSQDTAKVNLFPLSDASKRLLLMFW
jgi:hypothetical protein